MVLLCFYCGYLNNFYDKKNVTVHSTSHFIKPEEEISVLISFQTFKTFSDNLINANFKQVVLHLIFAIRLKSPLPIKIFETTNF